MAAINIRATAGREVKALIKTHCYNWMYLNKEAYIREVTKCNLQLTIQLQCAMAKSQRGINFLQINIIASNQVKIVFTYKLHWAYLWLPEWRRANPDFPLHRSVHQHSLVLVELDHWEVQPRGISSDPSCIRSTYQNRRIYINTKWVISFLRDHLLNSLKWPLLFEDMNSIMNICNIVELWWYS